MEMEGHIPPATCFCVFGLWWAVATLVAYSKSLVTKTAFKSSITFDCLVGERCKKWPCGAVLKIVATTLGFLLELQRGIGFIGAPYTHLPKPMGAYHTDVPTPIGLGVNHTHVPTPIGVNHTHVPTPIGVNHTHVPTPIGVNHTHVPTPIGVNHTHVPTPIGVNHTHVPTPIVANHTHVPTPIEAKYDMYVPTPIGPRHIHDVPRPIDTNMLHHVTMYAFFWLTGVVDVLEYFRLPLPSGSGHVAMGLAFLVEGLVWSNHIAGRQSVDKLIHVLLIGVTVVSVVVVLMEIKYRHIVWFPLARSFLMMLQGTWFWQAHFIVGGQVTHAFWRPTNQNLRTIAIYFCWHIGLNVVFLLVIGGIIHRIVGRLYRPGVSKGEDDEHVHQTVPLLNDVTDY